MVSLLVHGLCSGAGDAATAAGDRLSWDLPSVGGSCSPQVSTPAIRVLGRRGASPWHFQLEVF